jgi:uncharacterized protein (DUF433 family)
MSKKKIALLVGAALIVGVVALGGGAAFVYARGSIASGDGPPIPFFGRGGFRGGRSGMTGFAGDGNPMDMFNAAAEVVGMTPEELFAELQAGKTPQEILEEHDVDWATLYEEMHGQMPEDAEGHHWGGFGMMGFDPGDGCPMDMFNAAAEAVGMTPEELFAELQAGKTPQEILEEHDVDWSALRYNMQELMPESGFGHRGRGHRMGGFGGLGGDPMALLDAAAEELGMTPAALMAELADGKTPQEIVEAQGLDPEQFFSDLAGTALAQAVEDGKMTQEQADWLLKGLEQGYVPMGMHHGEGGHWGPCGGEETSSDSE